MYGVFPYWHRPEFRNEWMIAQGQALELILQSVQGERNDELFYSDLIRLAPGEEEAQIIASIRDDERRHNQMYRQIYKALTSHDIPVNGNDQYTKPKSYAEGLQTALFGELSAVEKYRTIWFGLSSGFYRDTVFGIILDELKHASKYNYLFTLHRTKG